MAQFNLRSRWISNLRTLTTVTFCVTIFYGIWFVFMCKHHSKLNNWLCLECVKYHLVALIGNYWEPGAGKEVNHSCLVSNWKKALHYIDRYNIIYCYDLPLQFEQTIPKYRPLDITKCPTTLPVDIFSSGTICCSKSTLTFQAVVKVKWVCLGCNVRNDLLTSTLEVRNNGLETPYQTYHLLQWLYCIQSRHHQTAAKTNKPVEIEHYK